MVPPISLSFANGPMMFFTFGQFLTALTAEFGWPRATVSLALLIGYAFAGVVSPFVGRLVDRFGVRPVTIGYAVLFGLSITSLSLIPASVAVFLALYTIAGFFGGGPAPIPYAKAVSGWFDEKRGPRAGHHDDRHRRCAAAAIYRPDDVGVRMARRIHRPRRPDADQPGERAALRFSADDIRRIFGAVFDILEITRTVHQGAVAPAPRALFCVLQARPD